jgi:hypothetical protein
VVGDVAVAVASEVRLAGSDGLDRNLGLHEEREPAKN